MIPMEKFLKLRCTQTSGNNQSVTSSIQLPVCGASKEDTNQITILRWNTHTYIYIAYGIRIHLGNHVTMTSDVSSKCWSETKPAELQLHPHQAFPCSSSSWFLQETCSWMHVSFQDTCVPHVELRMPSDSFPRPWQPETWSNMSKQKCYWLNLKHIHLSKTSTHLYSLSLCWLHSDLVYLLLISLITF